VPALCVFCGSSPGTRVEYVSAAVRLGEELARRKIDLVWGGGRVGLMGAVADAVLAAGGRAVGVIPRALTERELAHAGATHMHVVETMHERKALMAQLSDAFVALPGGFGTLDELCEILTWRQLGLHEKPIGLLDAAGYFGPLAAAFDHAVAEGFVQERHRSLLLLEQDPARLLDRLLEGPAGMRGESARREVTGA
jgi:uncharacterized protein (TIGR00730 family)